MLTKVAVSSSLHTVSEIRCLVSDSLHITPFQSIGSYQFDRSCEHTLVAVCTDDPSLSTFAIHIDSNGENVTGSTLAVQWSNRTVLLFSDNMVRTDNTGSAKRLGDVTVFESGLRVFKSGQNVSLEFFELGVAVTKVLSPSPSYVVTVASKSQLVDHLCGLCGDSSGRLVLDGDQRVVHLRTADRQELKELFVQYSLQPSSQLTPNRMECSES